MYTTTPKQPVGCHTEEGYYLCTTCVFIDDPLMCDGFCAEENAQKVY